MEKLQINADYKILPEKQENDIRHYMQKKYILVVQKSIKRAWLLFLVFLHCSIFILLSRESSGDSPF